MFIVKKLKVYMVRERQLGHASTDYNRHLNKQPKFKFLLFKPCRLCNASTFSHYFHPKKAQNTCQNCVLCKKHTYTGISRDGKERKIRVTKREFSIFREHGLIHQVIGYLKKNLTTCIMILVVSNYILGILKNLSN